MSGWKELGFGHNTLTEGTTASSGVRVFDSDPLGTDSIPDEGDPFDVEHLGIVLVNKKRDITHIDEDDICNNGYRWTCNYSTIEPDNSTSNPSTDIEQRSFTVGGEILSIDSTGSEWGWANGIGVPGDDADIKNQKLFITSPIGLISYTKEIDKDDYDAFKNELITKAGKINAAEFEGFAIGNVLFLGANGNLQTGADGVEFWKFTLNFKWKILNGPSAPATYTWQYLWRKDGIGKWAVPATGKTGFEANLYETASFTGQIGPPS